MERKSKAGVNDTMNHSQNRVSNDRCDPKYKRYRRIIAVLLIFCLIFAAVAGVLCYQARIPQKAAARMGWIEKSSYGVTNYTAQSWEKSLKSMDYDCDIVFFGDSLTAGGDFARYFDQVKICNLGLSGDTLDGMKKRVSMIESVKPEKIFIMGGINSLLDNNVDMTVKSYSELLDMIRERIPSAKLYVQSVLPIGTKKESTWYGGGVCKNETIRTFNQKLRELAAEKGMEYIDLYPLYEKDGKLNPEYTKDGVHISEHYEPWMDALKKYIP